MFKNAMTPKAQRTRARILDTALALLRARGYDATTMRTIATEAGVAVSNAYYYFQSKEHLIQAFYARTHTEHVEACRSVLARERNFKKRLLGVMRAKLDTIEPYHACAGVLFKTAADPASPLNPFSAESGPVRQESTDLFRQVVSGSTQRIPKALAGELPQLLWIYHMGIVLFWIHDRSPGRRRSYRLVEVTVDLIAQLIRLAATPLLRPVTRKALSLVRAVRTDTEHAPAAA